jgi:hypothetical protein
MTRRLTDGFVESDLPRWLVIQSELTYVLFQVPGSEDEVTMPPAAREKLAEHRIRFSKTNDMEIGGRVFLKREEWQRQIKKLAQQRKSDLSEKVEVGRITDPENPVIKAGVPLADGLFAKKRLPKGTLLAAYTGEVQTSKLNDCKLEEGEDQRALYTMELDETQTWFNKGMFEKSSSSERPIVLSDSCLVIDGTLFRNETAFANDYRDDIR